MASIILLPLSILLAVVTTVVKYTINFILFIIKTIIKGLERMLISDFRFMTEILKRVTKEFKR